MRCTSPSALSSAGLELASIVLAGSTYPQDSQLHCPLCSSYMLATLNHLLCINCGIIDIDIDELYKVVWVPND